MNTQEIARQIIASALNDVPASEVTESLLRMMDRTEGVTSYRLVVATRDDGKTEEQAIAEETKSVQELVLLGRQLQAIGRKPHLWAVGRLDNGRSASMKSLDEDMERAQTEWAASHPAEPTLPEVITTQAQAEEVADAVIRLANSQDLVTAQRFLDLLDRWVFEARATPTDPAQMAYNRASLAVEKARKG